MTTDQEERVEPFATVMELALEYGNLEVIIALHYLLGFQLEEESCCVSYQQKAEWWNREMSQLMARYEMEFHEADAVARINHRGAELVQ
jgi:hypothetical protein